jgi:hypothetical protein
MNRRLRVRVARIARRLPRLDVTERAAVRAALAALTDDELAALEAAMIAEAAGQPLIAAGLAAQAAFRRYLAVRGMLPTGTRRPRR